MPNTPPIQIDERLVTTAPTDVQATQADVLNYAEFLAQILEQHYRQYHRNMLLRGTSDYSKEQLEAVDNGTANLMKFRVQKGKRYLKVIQVEFDTFQNRNEYRDSSVHSFVDKNTGDVYKPASWRSPATKHVRFTFQKPEDIRFLLNPINVDWAGGYLYLR